jgi:RHS repeat-associated protein
LNSYYYRGEQYDPDLGLYYLRARYYNPVTGRFLNVDPMAGDGQRRYEFATADPVNGSDPSGNFVLESYWPLCCAAAWFPTINFDWCKITKSNPWTRYLPMCSGPPPLCPQCFAQLKYRIVPGHSIVLNHAFWYLGDASGQHYILDAGPSDEECSRTHDCGWLIDWPSEFIVDDDDPHGHYDTDVPGDATAWDAP